MSCQSVTSLEQAKAKLPSSVLPIDGLRRDFNGDLTKDALQMIVDGLKSRSVDPTDPAMKKKLIGDLATLLCSVNNQYQFLLKELFRQVAASENVDTAFVDTIKEKNIFMQDIINVSRHLYGLRVYDESSEFIEGWQNTASDTMPMTNLEGFTISHLQRDQEMLSSESYLELRKHMVDITQEKNVAASNYLGLYGFLNLVAIGLLIYVAAGPA